MKAEALKVEGMALEARNVVKLAAEGDHSASDWLTRDERGFWERQAQEMIDSTAEKRAALGLSDALALKEMADVLRLRVLRALIADAKGRARR